MVDAGLPATRGTGATTGVSLAIPDVRRAEDARTGRAFDVEEAAVKGAWLE